MRISTADVLRAAAARLGKVSDTPRLDAELLMAHAMGISREAMLMGDAGLPADFEALVTRRLMNEPVAYITGARDFWTLTVRVTPDVLIPRPDSETLIEAAVDRFGPAGPRTVLDLGTGSGALLLAALSQWPAATGLGIDVSAAAVVVATDNAVSLGMADRAEFRIGEWADGIDEGYDLILCNPPYVEDGVMLARQVVDYEPASALFAGPDGLDDYRRIAPQLPQVLRAGGIACIEIGSEQRDAVTALLTERGFDVTCRRDLAGNDRCLVAALTAS